MGFAGKTKNFRNFCTWCRAFVKSSYPSGRGYEVLITPKMKFLPDIAPGVRKAPLFLEALLSFSSYLGFKV